jgi:hypothetical protein
MCVDPDPDGLGARARKVLETPADDGPRSGGLVARLSPCCAASIERTTGGLFMEICSKCKGPAEEPRLGTS